MSTYEISKSSLLSLKAEILRKQEDFAKAKGENAEKIKIIKKKTPLELKNKGVDERSRRDFNDDEQDLLKQSRECLENKAKLYEKLASSKTSENIGRRFLVEFDKKRNDYISDEETEQKDYSDHDEEVNPAEQWVEYTDCLGRSRKCLRKDLEYFKSKDAELKPIVETRHGVEPNITEIQEEIFDIDDQPSTHDGNESDLELISSDVTRDKLRQQWEKEEEELRDRSDIHYQNVLFNEARQHGVGYYGFSKDEEVRRQQQEALKNLRKDTTAEQKKAKELRELREKQMAARIKAARNRRRARLGLPPEEENEEPANNNTSNDDDNGEEQKLAAKKEEEEKKAMEKRKKHVRPWDIGKESQKEHYVMSQEEWNEKKRLERHEEFAPPKLYNREFSGVRSISKYQEDTEKTLKFTTKKDKSDNQGKRHRSIAHDHFQEGSPVEENDDSDSDELMKDFKLIQNSALPEKKTEVINRYKNNFTTHPECDVPSGYFTGNRTDVQSSSMNKKLKKSHVISDTVEAGLKYLREQVEKKSYN